MLVYNMKIHSVYCNCGIKCAPDQRGAGEALEAFLFLIITAAAITTTDKQYIEIQLNEIIIITVS